MKTITITFDESESEAYEDVLKEAIEVERDAYLDERKTFDDDTDDDDIEWNSHAITVCDDLLTQLNKLFLEVNKVGSAVAVNTSKVFL